MATLSDDQLIPAAHRAAVEALEPDLLEPSPLPLLAALWYTHGGCWSLALAIREETRLPIELYYLHGHPAHAYVVDGDQALDARDGTLHRYRLGAQRLESVYSEEGLPARVAEALPPSAGLRSASGR